MLLHSHKITIVVQQRASALNAKRADNDVVRFADRYSHIPETTIVPRGPRGEIVVEERHDLEAPQAAFDARRVRLVASALKNFKQNEVANKDRLEGHRSFKFRGRRRQRPPKVRDPDRAIDQDHNGRDDRSWRISSRSPSQPRPLSDFNARACLRSLTISRRPSSTTARLVGKPVSFRA